MPEPSTALGALFSGSPGVANTAAVAAAAKGLLGNCIAGLLAAKAPADADGENCASACLHTTAGTTLLSQYLLGRSTSITLPC